MEHQHHHKQHKGKEISNEKLVAILSYFLVGIIWYFADESIQNRFTKFHVKQALNLFIVSLIGSLALTLIPGILGIILVKIYNLIILILWIIALINLVNEKNEEIPIIGPLAESYLKF